MVVRPKIPDGVADELREKYAKTDNEPFWVTIDRVVTKADAWETRGSDVL